MARRIWLTIAALFAMALPFTAKAGPWMRADTHNFVLYGNGSEAQLRDYATKLEKFDAALRYLLSLERDPDPNRLDIYLVADADDAGRLKGDRNVAGFYSPSLDGSFAIGNRDPKSNKLALDGLTVLFHEYAHHMMYRNFNYSYPSWFSEGFAEYVSTMQFNDDGSWTRGYPAFHRAVDLLATSRDYPVEAMIYNERSGKAANTFGLYAYGWLTVHMLYSTPEYHKQLDTYLRAFGQGTPPRVAAVNAFGDMRAFAKAVVKYRDGKLAWAKMTMPLDYEKALSLRTLSEDEGKLVQLTMARRSSTNAQKTRDGLAALAAKSPNNADIAYELGYAERDLAQETFQKERDSARAAKAKATPDAPTVKDSARQEEDEGDDVRGIDAGRYAAAFAALDRALAIDPKHRQALDLKGRMMIETLDRADTDGWKKARGYIVAANRLQPDDPAPLYDYYMSYLYQGIPPPAAAKAALAQAFGTVPEVEEISNQYAFAKAEEGEYRVAEEILKAQAFNPHEGGSLGPLHALADMERAAKGSTPIDAELKTLEAAMQPSAPAKAS